MNTTQRLVNTLSYLASSEAPRGVSEIGRQLGIGKASVYRLLFSLKSLGWVNQNPGTDRYSLSQRIMELGLTVLSRLDIGNVSLPYLYQLHDTIGETTTLSIRADLERVYIQQVPCKHELRQEVPLGRRLPLWAGAVGKAILAYMRESEIEEVIDQLRNSGVSLLASGQVINIEELRKELDEIRRQGFAIAVGERVLGVCGVAAPIFYHNDQVLGALGVSGPLPRFDIDLAKKYGPLLSKIAKKISSQMGAKR